MILDKKLLNIIAAIYGTCLSFLNVKVFIKKIHSGYFSTLF